MTEMHRPVSCLSYNTEFRAVSEMPGAAWRENKEK